MNRVIIIALVLLSVISAMADNNTTIRNYTSWNMGHARWSEPWACEALAECHCHSKGGLKRSILNASFYYDLALPARMLKTVWLK